MTVLSALLAAAVLVGGASTPDLGAIEGTVRDAESGEALPGATVWAESLDRGVATDVEGRFTIPGVAAGTHRLEVRYVGYASQTVDVTVREGETARVDVALGLDATLGEVVVEYERPTIARDAIGAPRVTGEGYSSASPPTASPAPSPADADGRRESRSRETSRDRAEGETPRPPMRRLDNRQPGLLTAGDIDDGLNWSAYLGYVRRTLDRTRQSRQAGGAFPDLSLDDRVVVRVVDEAGHPVAGARVTVEGVGGVRARQLVTEAGTDGRLALFPQYDFGRGTERLSIRVQAPGGQGRAQTETVRVGRFVGERAVRIRLPIRVAERPRAMDLAFVIDVTGSMGDELRYLTDEFEAIVTRLERRYPGVDLRFGLVAYRDQGDQFVVRRSEFTRSTSAMQRQLAALSASGGGDYPEAMDEALESALELEWRTGTAARVAFLVADAPPHAERTARALDAVREARARGIRLYPVAASGVADEAEYVMRAAAILTQGRHLFLTDDSGVGNAHAEPKIACYQVTALDNLLVRVIASELEGRRVEADRDEVIREVGDYDAGVCEAPAVVQRPTRRSRQQSELGYVE